MRSRGNRAPACAGNSLAYCGIRVLANGPGGLQCPEAWFFIVFTTGLGRPDSPNRTCGASVGNTVGTLRWTMVQVRPAWKSKHRACAGAYAGACASMCGHRFSNLKTCVFTMLATGLIISKGTTFCQKHMCSTCFCVCFESVVFRSSNLYATSRSGCIRLTTQGRVFWPRTSGDKCDPSLRKV